MQENDVGIDLPGKPAPKRRSCLGCLGRAAMGLLVLLVIVMAGGAIYQAAASASDLKKYPPPGELYDVGEYRIHLYCTGEGSPTVILEAGAGSPSLGWELVQEKVAGFTRVCSYDRPGFGWSSTASTPLSSEQVADTLHQLLVTANIPGPYVLVGHSDGGVYIRSYVKQYPSEVIGMVLVDSSHESQNLRFPPEYLNYSRQQNIIFKACQVLSPFGVIRLARLWNMLLPKSILSIDMGAGVLSTMYRTTYCEAYADELTSASTMLSQPEGPSSLGDMPLIVISAGVSLEKMLAQTPQYVVRGMGRETFTQIVQTMQDLQKDLVSLSTHGKQIIAEQSTHNVQWDQPDLVIEAIREVVEQVRSE